MAVDIGATNKYLDYEGLKKYDNKIKAELAKKVSSIDAATEDDLGLVKIGDGLSVTEGEISVKPKTNGAVTVSGDGIDIDLSKAQKASAATPGVVTIGDGLEATDGEVSVKAETNGGINVDADGISVNLKENGGLQVDEGDIAVKSKANGGVTIDANGLSVDWTKAPTAAEGQLGMVKPGDGIDIDEEGNISFDPDTLEDGSIDLDKIDGAEDLVKKSDMVNVYTYKGSVANYAGLSAKEAGATAGDVYNVEDTDMNYAWTGTTWDPLGSTFTISAITEEQINALFTED